ncbi:RNA methyltransferase [Halorhodospira halochloris]|uniref:RNA methyltransferase n=1 Tax=Halorhodospira halochloris TaxID=1052 RepID=UPI001EE844AB|nr:RNA methyltransferase [Halorhodospira halochloris]MCG5548439.1 RNA methyltransferase [Halorhodospira halochloris]
MGISFARWAYDINRSDKIHGQSISPAVEYWLDYIEVGLNPDKIRIVLVGTSHPGNIGATARAMRTMGLERLALVEPQCDPLGEEAIARATSAEDVLRQASVHEELGAALSGCRLVYGLSARPRAENYRVSDLRTAVSEAMGEGDAEQAWVFGRERTGLSNLELDRCHALVHIPADPQYSSLNLAQSVQLVAWELRMAMASASPIVCAEEPPAGVDTLERFFAHLEQTATAVGFLQRQNPELTMRRLRNIFRRARPSADEVRMLRGLLSHVLDQRRWL